MDAPLSDDANASRIASAASPACNPPPWRLMPSRDVARLLGGVSIQSLANWRIRGTGPAFVGEVRGKGKKIFYRRADVLAWLSCQRGQPKEAWEICHNWLAERGLTLQSPAKEGVWWLTEALDEAF